MSNEIVHTLPPRDSFDDFLPEILALVIGINRYSSPEFDNLAAAVSDANQFEAFLKEKLEVPQTNITSLRDEGATRAAIIGGFITLRDHPKIVKNQAAVIIYFAGHGARVEKPAEWVDWITASGEIELMCPSDMGKRDDGEETPGIPDRTISALLNSISESKGNNITLILDCCSSGGLNRTKRNSFNPIHNGYVPRQVYNAPPIPSNCDEKIISMGSIRNARVATGFTNKLHASHVLLAACGREQYAYEHPNTNSGLFTTSLLQTLTSEDINDLTYTSLMHRLRMPAWQTPHCEGQHVGRRLFNTRVLGADASFILGQLELEKNIDGTKYCILHAGAAQGITEGSIFEIHATNLIPDARHLNPACGELVASSIGAFKSRLTFLPNTSEFPVPHIFYCKLLRRGLQLIRIFCADKQWLESVFPPEIREELSITLSDKPSAASLQLCLLDDKVHFSHNHPMINPWLGPQIPHTIDRSEVNRLREVVRKLSHFIYHLARKPSNNFQSVSMELRVLNSKSNSEYDKILCPSGPNLIEKEPAAIVVDENAQLGMVIHNGTQHPLYPYLFYFDPSDLSIVEWYTSPFGAGQGRFTNKVDAPLLPQSSFAIGYGDGGVSPWQFLLRDGEDKDVGFFKLFLTTSPADFSSILQETPFEESKAPSIRSGKNQPPRLDEWGTILSTVIQVRDQEQLAELNLDGHDDNDIKPFC